MKLAPPGNRDGVTPARVALALFLCAIIPLLAYAAAPAWWSQRGVLNDNVAADDYAVANQGQLKNIAKAAMAEMDATLRGGAGIAIHDLVLSWSTPVSTTNDFTPLNAGQLKSVAKPFYDRLIAVKYASAYPWFGHGDVPDDFAVVNIGQLKNVFSFDLTSIDLTHDSDQNGLPDWWEKYYFGIVGVAPNALAPRGDGLTNIQAFQSHADPVQFNDWIATLPDRFDESVVAEQLVNRTLIVTNNSASAEELSVTTHNTASFKPSFTDSNAPEGPQYVWNDISTTGTHLDVVSDADDDSEPVTLSFSFPFSGDTYPTVYVSSNGFLTFAGRSNEYGNYPLPNPSAPRAMIAPFGSDLYPDQGGDIYYQDFGDRVIVQFDKVLYWTFSHNQWGYVEETFQVVLQSDGTIFFYYKDVEGGLNDLTVGLQDAAGDKGLTIAHGTPYIKPNLAVRIGQDQSWLTPSRSSLTLASGQSGAVNVAFDARGVEQKLFSGGITITDDLGRALDIPVTMNVIDDNELDNDGDGLTNAQERALGTDPNNTDSDRDGMADGWEIAHQLDPRLNDAADDPDGDGFTNLDEFHNKTDPFTVSVRLVDTLDDWDSVVSQSGDWQLDSTNPEYFDGDTSRAVRTSTAPTSLVYFTPALVSVEATIYYKDTLGSDQLRFFSSIDNNTWTEVAATKAADWPAGGGWHGATFASSQPIPPNTNYFRIDVSGADPAWTPQLGQIAFAHNDVNAPVAEFRGVGVSAGVETPIVLVATDADADPISYRIVGQPTHGTLRGMPPEVTYTADADYVGQDQLVFVAHDGARSSSPATVFISVSPAPPANVAFQELSNSSAQLNWTGQSTSGFIIERSTDGGLTWQQLGQVGAGMNAFTDSSYASGKFYSYRVTAKGSTNSLPSTQISSRGTDPNTADSDGDGITDNREAQLHSNPDETDTDGDGVPDNEDGAPSDASRWSKAIPRHYAVIDLGALPGGRGNFALAINNSGHVLCEDQYDGRFFLWQDGRRTELPGNFSPSALNDSDIVVGNTTFYFSAFFPLAPRAEYWANGQLVSLPQVSVGRSGFPHLPSVMSFAADINNAGQVIGWGSSDGGAFFPTVWTLGGGGTQVDSTLGVRVFPYAISDSGAVLATIEAGLGNDTYLLPSTRLGGRASGYHINAGGTIVTGRQVWLQGATGSPQDMNSLLVPESAVTIDDAVDITNANALLGDAHDDAGDSYLAVIQLPSATEPMKAYEVIESDDRISWLYPSGINDNGAIAATAFYKDGTNHAVELVPAQLMVDANRDGQMSFDDSAIRRRDETSEDRPYRFWLNDDQDTAPVPYEGDRVPADAPDYGLHQIKSKRNLEDFARLWMNLGGLQEALTPPRPGVTPRVRIGLKWKNTGDTNPAINIYPSEDIDGSTNYLTSDDAAGRQIGSDRFNNAIVDANGRNTLDANGTFIFNADYWNDFPWDGSQKKCFLFEGAGEGKGELTIVLVDAAGKEIAEGGSIWLDLKDVKKMYERASGTPEPINAPYASNGGNFDDTSLNYIPDVSPRFEKAADETEQCLIFVHGWRLNPAFATNFAETMFKRLWWQGYQGRFVAFRWATKTSFVSYNTSEWLAWKYGESLRNYVENYLKREMPGYTMNVAAHSMGNIVTGSALQYGMTLDAYMLMEAAIPAGCYDDSVNNYARFVAKEVTKPTPDQPSEGGYRRLLSPIADKVGRYVSFFNIDDYALATGTVGVAELGFQTNWEQNELDYKPDSFGSGTYSYAGGGTSYFQSSAPDSEERRITDPHESLAFVARPRSKAAGAEVHNATVFKNVVNLETVCDFTASVDDHSGQFTRRIQQLNSFYRRMSDELKQ